MITIQDFDEIVIDNPFLKNENVGYGIKKIFWEFFIYYNPAGLNYNGHSNSTCKYITMTNDLTSVGYKIIREDDHIVIEELFRNDRNRYDREIVTDTKKLAKVETKFNDLKKIVKKQIAEHYKAINRLQNLKIKFDFDTTKEFLEILQPKITDKQQEKIIKQLAKIEKNPMNYFSEPTDTIDANPKNIATSLYTVVTDTWCTIDANPKNIATSLFSQVLFNELEQSKSLIIVDWKSPYEEVLGLILPIFRKLEITPDERLKEPENYETELFLYSINTILLEKNYVIVTFSEGSDTFVLGFTTQKDYEQLEKYAKKIKVKVRKW